MMHHRALLPLKDEKTRERLAKKAAEKPLTGKALKSEVDKALAKQRQGEKRGRPKLPAFEKTLNQFGRALDADGAFDDLDAIDDLEPERAKELYQTVTGLKLKCEELQKALQTKVPGFE